MRRGAARETTSLDGRQRTRGEIRFPAPGVVRRSTTTRAPEGVQWHAGADDPDRRSAGMAVHEIEQLLVHLVGLSAAGADRGRRTVLEVIAHELAPDASQGLVDGGDLREDVGAVAALLDHALDPADLPLDAAQALEVLRLRRRGHGHGPAPASHVVSDCARALRGRAVAVAPAAKAE